MPLNLPLNRGPIDDSDVHLQDLLSDLQGNILNGHGRDHAVHMMLRFNAARIADAKAWIATFAATRVTSAKAQLDSSEAFKSTGVDAGVFGHFALSAAGYAALGVTNLPKPSNPLNRSEEVFRDGMKSRQASLLDPPSTEWDGGFQGEIHALVLLAADNPRDLITAERQVLAELEAFEVLPGTGQTPVSNANPIAEAVAVERGFALRRRFDATDGPFGVNVEPFGYADGVSQPLFLKRQVEADRAKTGTGVWDPSASLNLLLVPDPNGRPQISFGSFLVFRKLEQNVRDFKKAEVALARELGVPTKLVGAMAVGRYEDGTPLVMQPGDGAPPIRNDFDYGGDPLGLTCPFQAHIRKTNPRTESVNSTGPFAKTVSEELGHRIARRGIPYGGPLTIGASLDDLPVHGVGLLFMCYQADIWEQFEFIQRFWANNPDFVQPGLGGPGQAGYAANGGTGIDAVIGQRIPGTFDPVVGHEGFPAQNWPRSWGQPTTKATTTFAEFVKLKGGEYLFSPSLSSLRNL